MADPVATVEKIIKIGLKIKGAVDTVRHNDKVCSEIRRLVLRISAILWQLQQTGTMNDRPAMNDPLEDLEKSLQHALELVTACQERSTIRGLITTGDLAKQLRRVKEDIWSNQMLVCMAMHTTTIVLLTIQAGGHTPPRQTEDEGAVHSTDDVRDAIGRSELTDVQNSILPGRETSAAIRELKWSELKTATNGFSDDNIIGKGGTFIVYKGVLKDGITVSIKFQKDDSIWPPPCSYYQLLDVVSKLRHKNIVRLVGYGHEDLSTSVMQLFKRKKEPVKERKFIWIEEYVPNGSLEDIVQGSRLDWSSLFPIIDGVAQGIHYLHELCVVHMDVKPRNIQLDSDLNPIITDFDISLMLDDNDEMVMDIVAGTPRYLDPVSAKEGTASTKSDVYSFGVTILETVGSIRRCHRPLTAVTEDFFNRWAWRAWEAGRIEEEFDSSSFDGSQLMEIKRCVQVGLLCARVDRCRPPHNVGCS